METKPEAQENAQESTPAAANWMGKLQDQYRQTKEHAETYPYVWGSYILVYGGFGLWLTYRWRKLRATEGRVQILQERLRKLIETEKPSNSAATVTEQSPSSAPLTKKLPPPADNATKIVGM